MHQPPCQRPRLLAAIALGALLLLSVGSPRAREPDGTIAARPRGARVSAPLPPRRPADLLPVPAPKTDHAPSSRQESAARPSVCLQAFAEGGGLTLPLKTSSESGDCGIEDPVTFQRIKLPDGAELELDSPVTARCSFALEVLAWLRDDLQAVAAGEIGRAARLAGVGGHACRSRNGIAGAPISEHASGNALDLSAVVMRDGRAIALADRDADSRPLREAIKKGACNRFTTVLGPGSDSSHQDHLHLDMRQRPRGYRICQWDIE